MKKLLWAALIAAICLVPLSTLRAQVPQLLNFQGRITVGTTNFDGAGQFKFALVNGNGSVTYWSNDGSSTAGSEPSTSVALTVTRGLYSVVLGETAIPHMTAIAPSVFNNGDVRLRIWFNDGVNGSQLLAPDQRIAAVGYAMMAANVPDGAITTPKIATGAVTSTQLASGAAANNLASDNQSGVGTGGIVLSSDPASASLLAAGYSKFTDALLGEAWSAIPTTGAPEGRSYHTAVWTGTEMIVWGGYDGTVPKVLNTGGRFNPATGAWTATNFANAPFARWQHTAIWTGSEMIVWGGDNSTGTFYNNGSRYRPSTDTWTIVNPISNPAGRSDHSTVWTGTEMIVWGGVTNGPSYFNNGGRYNPSTDMWVATSTTNAPSARYQHVAVWTGTEMIVWGGGTGSTYFTDGFRYNPSTNTWSSAISTTNAPTARRDARAVWTGTEMIVWGGYNAGVYLGDGARYNPSTDTWTPLPSSGAPPGRADSIAVWAGDRMFIWGGYGGTRLSTGGAYVPATNSWTTTAAAPIQGRGDHTAIWTGKQVILWGGDGSTGEFFADGARWTPPQTYYLYQRN